MAQAVVMPKFGQTVEEATIVKWHKKAGDTVKKGDVLFEVETEKAVLEAESFFDGVLLKVFIGEGQSAVVGSTIGYIGQAGEKTPDAPPASEAPPPAPAAKAAAPAAPTSAPRPQPGPAPAMPAAAPARPAPAPVPAAPQRLFISPRAKALVEARCISPAPIRGSGPNGRITVRDVEAYLAERGYDRLKISPAAKHLAGKEKIDILSVKGTGSDGRIMIHDVQRALEERPKKMSKMRQVIAKRLTDSFTGTPHFYVSVSADMTDLLTYRQELKAAGKVYTVTDFILEAVILSLREFPVLNSVTDGSTVRWHGTIDLGMAVSLDEGLVVPAIRSADELSMQELHDTCQQLAAKAREGKLLPDEMSGTTFTVSNMGMMNVDNFNAIINPGESGILAVASTIPTAVVREGKVVPRSMMKMTLSVDHRIVDGAVGANFVNAIKAKLEDMELWKSLT